MRVIKRSQKRVQLNIKKIENAIYYAMVRANDGTRKNAKEIANTVLNLIPTDRTEIYAGEIQDLVESTLLKTSKVKTAKEYIIYRHKRDEYLKDVPDHVKKLTRESKKFFRNSFAEFIYYRTYSRWIDKESRRETWVETIDRYMDFMRENLGNKLKDDEYGEIREAILSQEVVPSMRLLWAAGDAARKNNVTAYNCSFIAPSKFKDFGEILFLLMSGTGVGFSVETQTAQNLPLIKRQNGNSKTSNHTIEDSKEGWADSIIFGLKTWFSGDDVIFDYSKIRPGGSRLKTMGGRSAGPEPLKQLLDFARDKVRTRQGKRLSNLDVHDIICKIGEIVVMGGVRRSATISLSDLDDIEMRDAKNGQFYLKEPQRSMANNSAVYNHKPTTTEFLEEWLALAKSGSGERGIFNRGNIEENLPERRKKINSEKIEYFGCNPCGEILLRNKSFCNLTEVIARHSDTEKSLLRKTRIAAILGTYQSTLVNFPYLSKEWKKNCEEERLLGVSITGQWDCSVVREKQTLRKLRNLSVEVNKEYAKRFKVNQSVAVTCVKPSGTVSQLVDSASGMHPRHSKYYIRRVRISANDPLFEMMKDQGVPYCPEVGQYEDRATTFVLEFPIKSPKGSIIKDKINALDQLSHWKLVKENFTEHNPSVTIYVGDNEWIKVANWIYKNWNIIGGLSFLPKDEHIYQLAPYEEITRKQYDAMVSRMPKIDFSSIVRYENEDKTEGSKEVACVSGTCEI